MAQLTGSNMCDLLPPHNTLQDRHSNYQVQAMRKQEQKENIVTYPRATKQQVAVQDLKGVPALVVAAL